MVLSPLPSGDFIVCFYFVGLVFLDVIFLHQGILGSHILESSSEFLRSDIILLLLFFQFYWHCQTSLSNPKNNPSRFLQRMIHVLLLWYRLAVHKIHIYLFEVSSLSISPSWYTFYLSIIHCHCSPPLKLTLVHFLTLFCHVVPRRLSLLLRFGIFYTLSDLLKSRWKISQLCSFYRFLTFFYSIVLYICQALYCFIFWQFLIGRLRFVCRTFWDRFRSECFFICIGK